MLVRDENKLIVRFADNLPDLEQWLQAKPRDWSIQCSRSNKAEASWDRSVGYDGALRLAKTGWSEGARDILFSALEVPPVKAESDLRYDVAGDMPDVARFSAGDPLHMVSRRKQKINKPVVHLVVNVVCSGAVGAKQFMTYGGALTALVDQIENTGRRVELDAISIVECRGKRLLVGWKVKQAGDALDLSAIAYSVAHPAAFRRLMFAMYERTPRNCEDYGYGYPAPATQADCAAIDAPDALLLDGIGLSYGISTAETNKKLARNVEQALGITILEEK